MQRKPAAADVPTAGNIAGRKRLWAALAILMRMDDQARANDTAKAAGTFPGKAGDCTMETFPGVINSPAGQIQDFPHA